MAQRSASTARMYEMAAHLLLADVPFSRNRNFDAFRDRRFERAIALYRRLRALAADLERARKEGMKLVVTEEVRADRPAVRIEITGERERRAAWLERPAWDVLMQHPGARAAVEALKTVAAA